METTEQQEQRNHQIARHAEALRICATSWLCHPDWDEAEHLSYLQNDEGFFAPGEEITVVAWPEGPSTAPLERYVSMWLRHPERCFETVLRRS